MNLIIPKKLDTAAFREAWMEWMEYRMGAKKKLINPEVTFRIHLRKLERFGVAGALLAIETAINNNWQGLFEIKPYHAEEKEDWIEREMRLKEEKKERERKAELAAAAPPPASKKTGKIKNTATFEEQETTMYSRSSPINKIAGTQDEAEIEAQVDSNATLDRERDENIEIPKEEIDPPF